MLTLVYDPLDGDRMHDGEIPEVLDAMLSVQAKQEAGDPHTRRDVRLIYANELIFLAVRAACAEGHLIPALVQFEYQGQTYAIDRFGRTDFPVEIALRFISQLAQTA